ncbi:MAG: methionine--tRNA ligase, partial [Pseudonocardiaceae bacterium]
ISMAAKYLGEIPAVTALTDADRALLQASRQAFGVVGTLLQRCRFKAAITEAMRMVGEANRYLSDQAPWKLSADRADERVRRDTVLHVALQLVDDCKSLLTPFLPHSSQRVFELLGGSGVWAAAPRIDEVEEQGNPSSPYAIITGDYAGELATWQSRPLPVGRKLAPPKPVFVKLDPSIVDEELARLEDR